MPPSRNDPQDLRGRAYFIDVDGTLERKIFGFEMPLGGMVEAVRLLKGQGARLYLWSTGGPSHAEQAARDAGIAELFECFLPKPNVYVDDKPVKAWNDCERWKPGKLKKLAKEAAKKAPEKAVNRKPRRRVKR
jgi:hypothetical protein